MSYYCEDCGQPCKAEPLGRLIVSDCHGADVLNERDEIVTLADAVATWLDDGARAQGA